MELKDHIKKARKELGKNQTEIATQLGITLRQYGKWEKGTVIPSIEKIEKLEGVLHTKLLDKIGPKQELNVPRGNENRNRSGEKFDFTQLQTATILKEVRSTLDLSQQAIADRIGISKDLYLKIEKVKRNVTLYTWVLALKFLNELPAEEFEKVKDILDNPPAETDLLKFEEDEDDESYRRKPGQDQDCKKQLAFLQSVIDNQKTLIEQKDIIINQMHSMQKK